MFEIFGKSNRVFRQYCQKIYTCIFPNRDYYVIDSLNLVLDIPHWEYSFGMDVEYTGNISYCRQHAAVCDAASTINPSANRSHW